MSAPLVWQVIWIDERGQGFGACGHRHPNASDATLCPFEPEGLPVVCAGLVRQVRDPDYRTQREPLKRIWRRPQLTFNFEGL